VSYNKIKLSVGLFVITIFIIVATLLILLLDKKGTFNKRYSYYFTADTANSFNVGMPLKFSGFNIGEIDKISLKNNGAVDMIFSVDEENIKWVSQGSILMIKKPLIGSSHIELYTALGNPPLAENSTLTLYMSDDINDMISKFEPVLEKFTSIITNIDLLTNSLSQKDSDFYYTMKNIRTITTKIANDGSILTSITGDKKSTKKLINSLDLMKDVMIEIHIIAKEVNKITASLNGDIIQPSSNTIKELELIMKDVKQKLQVLEGTVNAVGSYDKDLVELKDQISLGVAKSNQIMDKVDSIMQSESSSKVLLP